MLEATPTAQSNKSKIKHQEKYMELPFNKDNFMALQAAKTTVDNRLTEALASLETANTALEAKDLEMTTSNEAHEQALIDVAVKAKETFVTQTETRIKEAFEANVAGADTVVEMINADSDEKSSEILLSSEKTEALKQGGEIQAGAWDNIVKTKG